MDINKIGDREVRARISEIIYSMSETEKQHFLKGLEKWQQLKPSDHNLSIKEVLVRISNIIYRISDAEKRNLLKGLEKWRQSKRVERRKQHRKPISISAICKTSNCFFKDPIKNISSDGLFIETGIPLSDNQDLSVTFSPSDSGNPITIIGKIVWKNPKGIGVKLYDTIPDI